MKRIEVGFKDIAENIKKNKKGMLIIFLGILLAGVVWGYMDYRTYEQKAYTVEDTIVQKVNLKHLKKDETYYYMAYMELKEKSYGLNTYIQYLKQVNLNGQNMKKVSELETAAVEEQKKFAEIREFYISEKPMICDDLDAAKQFVRQKIAIAKLQLDEADKIKVYAEQEIKIWEDHLAKIEDPDFDELQKINNKMDLLMEEETDSINALVERFNVLIADIEAEEQYEVVYNPYLLREYCDMVGIAGELYRKDAVNVDKQKALIYARSIAGTDSREERFYAILTFSVLLGIAFSLLYGGLRKREIC